MVAGLVERADLVVESRGQDMLADWGLDRGLHRGRPSISVVHYAGFGSTGPYADYRVGLISSSKS